MSSTYIHRQLQFSKELLNGVEHQAFIARAVELGCIQGETQEDLLKVALESGMAYLEIPAARTYPDDAEERTRYLGSHGGIFALHSPGEVSDEWSVSVVEDMEDFMGVNNG
jgi:hypothetical protein